MENPNLDRDSTPSSTLPSSSSRLKIYNGTFSDESVWKISLRPFPFLLSPVVRKHIPILPIACTLPFIIFVYLADLVHVCHLFDADGVAE